MSDIENAREVNFVPAWVGNDGARGGAEQSNQPLSIRIGYGIPEVPFTKSAAGSPEGAEQSGLPINGALSYTDSNRAQKEFATTGSTVHQADRSSSLLMEPIYGSPSKETAPLGSGAEGAGWSGQWQALNFPDLNFYNQKPSGGSDRWQQYSPSPVAGYPYESAQQYSPSPVANYPYDRWQQNRQSDYPGWNQENSDAPNLIIREEFQVADLLFKQIQTTMNMLNVELSTLRRDLDSIFSQLNLPVPRPEPRPEPSPEPSPQPPRPEPRPEPSPQPPRPEPSPEPPRPEPSPQPPRPEPSPQPPRPEPSPQPPQPEVRPQQESERHHGVNLAGAEFDEHNFPGRSGINYMFPTTQELDYYKQNGMDLIRMPFLWERMQPGLLNKYSPAANVDKSFNPEYAKQMDDFLTAADQRGMKVILDAHDYGRYNYQVVGASNITNDDFKQFWGQMAKTFGQHSSIYGYDLSNEPHDEANETWHAAAQAGVDGIRATGDKHAVVVEGNQWAGTQSWAQNNSDLSVQDPANNTIYEAHSYWDSDHSGQYNGGAQGSYWRAVSDARNQNVLGPNEDPSNLGVNDAKQFVDWLKVHNAKGLIGEYGVPSWDSNWVKMQDKFLAYAKANNVDTTAWGGGPMWGSGYVMSLETGPGGPLSVTGPEPLNMKSVAADGSGASQ